MVLSHIHICAKRARARARRRSTWCAVAQRGPYAIPSLSLSLGKRAAASVQDSKRARQRACKTATKRAARVCVCADSNNLFEIRLVVVSILGKVASCGPALRLNCRKRWRARCWRCAERVGERVARLEQGWSEKSVRRVRCCPNVSQTMRMERKRVGKHVAMFKKCCRPWWGSNPRPSADIFRVSELGNVFDSA